MSRTCQAQVGPTEMLMNITANVEAILRQLRRPDQPRMLWIDAICINQDDAREREAQVLLMRRIYSAAERTLIWLGKNDETTRDAIRCIELMKANYLKLAVEHRSRLLQDLELVKFRPWTFDVSHQGYVDESAWQAFARLLSKPWFSRVWVYQEVTVSSAISLMCGDVSIIWVDLCKACGIVEDFNLDIGFREQEALHTSVLVMEEARDTHSRSVIEVAEGSMAPRGLSPIEENRSLEGFEGTLYPRIDITLLLLRWAKATDPRDKVYALLGISSGFSKRRLAPDYTLPLGAVYVQTAKALSKVDGLSRLAFLSFVQHSNRRLSSDLPSWVPDWRDALHAPWLIYNSGFWSANAARAQITFPPLADPDELVVSGISLMRVAVLGSQAGVKHGIPSELILRELPNPYVCPWKVAFSEGLNLEEDPRGRLAPSDSCQCKTSFWDWKRRHRNHCEEFVAFQKPDADFELLGWPAHEADQTSVAWDQLQGNRGIAYGRRLFIMDLGYIGLAPLATAVGDEVCVLLGGNVPYVIRQEGQRYRFVGECYVFGIMDGEVLDGLDPSVCTNFVLF
ncbi:hypothetical protein ACJ41O_006356 [Fusarium nematophilum]